MRGEVIRFMWDEGVDGSPLWDLGGLLPDDVTWLRETLGLSEALAKKLRQWGRDVHKMKFLVDLPLAEKEARERAFDEAAEALVAQLRNELPQLTLVHKTLL